MHYYNSMQIKKTNKKFYFHKINSCHLTPLPQKKILWLALSLPQYFSCAGTEINLNLGQQIKLIPTKINYLHKMKYRLNET